MDSLSHHGWPSQDPNRHHVTSSHQWCDISLPAVFAPTCDKSCCFFVAWPPSFRLLPLRLFLLLPVSIILETYTPKCTPPTLWACHISCSSMWILRISYSSMYLCSTSSASNHEPHQGEEGNNKYDAENKPKNNPRLAAALTLIFSRRRCQANNTTHRHNSIKKQVRSYRGHRSQVRRQGSATHRS